MTAKPHPAVERRHLANLFLSANKAMQERAWDRLYEEGFTTISVSHSRLLRFLRRHANGGRLGQFAEWAGITQQSATYLVEHLESNGYVVRHPDPADGRAQLINFTEKGRAAESILIGEFEAIEREMRARYGAELIDAMRGVLEEIATPWEAGHGVRKTRRPAAVGRER